MPSLYHAQIGGEAEVYLNGDFIDAKFEGDSTLKTFVEFIQQEFDYSKVTKPGTMLFSFVIDKEGNVKNIKVVRMLDVESATEIIRVMKKCPKWDPAKRGGTPVEIEIKYPMVFKLKKTN